MITSMSNPQMKQVQQLMKKAKVRRESGLFVAEGIKMFCEAPKDRIERVYVSSSFLREPGNREILKDKGFAEANERRRETDIRRQETDIRRQETDKSLQEAANRLQEVDDRVFRALSDTVTPQGVLCLVKQREYSLEEILGLDGRDFGGGRCAPFLMVLEDLQDPGNLGTILRTGEGAGVSGVILGKNCVDLYNPKVIRSTMGSVYRMKVCIVESVAGALPKLHSCGVRTYAAHLCGEKFYDEEDYRTGTAFLIGNEGNGLSDEAAKAAGGLIKIPMAGEVESLNAAMAAGILMYEASRQRGTGRRQGGGKL